MDWLAHIWSADAQLLLAFSAHNQIIALVAFFKGLCELSNYGTDASSLKERGKKSLFARNCKLLLRKGKID